MVENLWMILSDSATDKNVAVLAHDPVAGRVEIFANDKELREAFEIVQDSEFSFQNSEKVKNVTAFFEQKMTKNHPDYLLYLVQSFLFPYQIRSFGVTRRNVKDTLEYYRNYL